MGGRARGAGAGVTGRLVQDVGDLVRRGRPFALATVVWRRAPSSGKVGDKAVITPDGGVTGWLGGACAQPTVVRTALESLTDGRPRLLSLGTTLEHDRPGVDRVPMACTSEGAMEVYVEPMLPAPLLVVIGRSPAVEVLVGMAGHLGWRTTVVDDGGSAVDHPGADRVVPTLDLRDLPVDGGTFVVVATQGHYDEPALEHALATPAGYIGLIASAKRAATVFEWLRERDASDEALARVHAPAGMDLGPVQHEEIAVAILAQLVALRASGAVVAPVAVAVAADDVDPVCGMTVEVAAAHNTTGHDGVTYYFCAAGCLRAFTADPQSFLQPT
ncbi:MAG: YHS domain-containing protein [Nitriliruptorales bacterium]|nr:YHS domain-containing protein [Nitriliruptorales bacterium]